MKNVAVAKKTGIIENFDEDKLHRSLIRSGASRETSEKILTHIKSELKNIPSSDFFKKEGQITTEQIFTHAFSLLRKENLSASIRYSMRKAIMDLGPTGFPFELLVAKIWRHAGFETETGVEMQGSCVAHEVDVIAWNDQKLIIAEAKFHNTLTIKSDLKVVLYIKERFDDLENNYFDYGKKRRIDENYLITNTKFSIQAIHYAECKGMKLIGWNYPKKGNLLDMIEHAGIHPITCLTSLNQKEKAALIAEGFISCSELMNREIHLIELGIPANRVAKVIREMKDIKPQSKPWAHV